MSDLSSTLFNLLKTSMIISVDNQSLSCVVVELLGSFGGRNKNQMVEDLQRSGSENKDPVGDVRK